MFQRVLMVVAVALGILAVTFLIVMCVYIDKYNKLAATTEPPIPSAVTDAVISSDKNPQPTSGTTDTTPSPDENLLQRSEKVLTLLSPMITVAELQSTLFFTPFH